MMCSFILILLAGLVPILSLNNGLARTPPMGWMSWERFRCIVDCDLYPDDCISDRLFRKMADLMASEGYLEAGYEYLIIEDCWLAKERDEHGRLQPDPNRFPFGMKNLSDYVHSKGLKFGLHGNYGSRTCSGYPGMLDHMEIDAKTYAEWGVDYLKIDGCHAKYSDYAKGYTEFGRYLNETGRSIVYSCSWPSYFEAVIILRPNYTHISEVCNLWRNWFDIQDSKASMIRILRWFGRNQNRIAPFAGPGQWNDPDVLIIGNFGLSYEQSKAQMALWAILAAPLIISTDLRAIKDPYKKILLNKEVIKINQDAMGFQGMRTLQISGIDIWARPITPMVDAAWSYAVAFHSNRDDGHPYAIRVTLSEIGLKHPGGYSIKGVYEPWEEEILEVDEEFVVKVNPSGVVLIKATPVAFKLQ